MKKWIAMSTVVLVLLAGLMVAQRWGGSPEVDGAASKGALHSVQRQAIADSVTQPVGGGAENGSNGYSAIRVDEPENHGSEMPSRQFPRPARSSQSPDPRLSEAQKYAHQARLDVQEARIDSLILQLDDNLQDSERRREIQLQLKQESEAYKRSALALAKDLMKRAVSNSDR